VDGLEQGSHHGEQVRFGIDWSRSRGGKGRSGDPVIHPRAKLGLSYREEEEAVGTPAGGGSPLRLLLKWGRG